MLCFRLLNEKEPAARLDVAVTTLAQGHPTEGVFAVEPNSFRQVPKAPFAYWVSDRVRGLFTTLDAFESDGQTVKQGLATADDFRFVRLAWELPVAQSFSDARVWVPFAKGGSFSPFYADVHLRVNWGCDGAELKAWAETLPGCSHWSRRIASTDYYFRAGLTWPRRTQSGLALRALPAGCVFADKGPAALVDQDDAETLCRLLCITTSQPFRGLVEIQMAFGSYEVGVIRRTVLPSTTDPRLDALARSAWRSKRCTDTCNLASHAFFVPVLVDKHSDLSSAIDCRNSALAELEGQLKGIQEQIDDIVFDLYGIGDEDRQALVRMLGNSSVSADSDDEVEDEEEASSAHAEGPALVSELIDYGLGCAFGRWDIRFASKELSAPEPPEPFDPLPICPPGMLQNADGFPMGKNEGVSLKEEGRYPLHVTWDGILVDDEGHPEDIVARLRDVLAVIWQHKADAIEAEACEMLGVKAKSREKLDALRVYFRDPNKFFKDHLGRYSKSRRKAPIYWPLSTESGSYTLWIYYHRLDSQTLYTCVREFVDPKREQIGRDIESLRTRVGDGGTTEERQRLEDLTAFHSELKTFRDRLLNVAGHPYRPDLNDGVQITAAPLWLLFRHKPWQSLLKKTWEELSKKEKYDWSHLAMSIWPHRVVPKCADDRSFAIAHEIEHLLWVPDRKKPDKYRKLMTPAEEVKLIKSYGYTEEDVEQFASDRAAAEEAAVADYFWVEDTNVGWRPRLSPEQEIKAEIARRKGR